ncbi:MAG: hypothetical protein ACRC4M_05635 [Mycoplasma sp.]
MTKITIKYEKENFDAFRKNIKIMLGLFPTLKKENIKCENNTVYIKVLEDTEFGGIISFLRETEAIDIEVE